VIEGRTTKGYGGIEWGGPQKRVKEANWKRGIPVLAGESVNGRSNGRTTIETGNH
jgi:L-ascorbate metabolism protein UlaG (beta-lactamase superfamily)